MDWTSRVLQNGFYPHRLDSSSFSIQNRHQIMMDTFLLFCFQSSRRLDENPEKQILLTAIFSYSFGLTACHLLYDWMDLVSYLTLFSFIWSLSFVRASRGFSSRLIETTFCNQTIDVNRKAISWWSIEGKLHQFEKSAIETWYESSVLCLHECLQGFRIECQRPFFEEI